MAKDEATAPGKNRVPAAPAARKALRVMVPPLFLTRLARTHPPLVAAGWMIAASFCFAILNACIRSLSDSMHAFETAFFRNLFGLVFMLPWLYRAGLGALKTNRFPLYLTRSVIGLISMMCGFSALAMMPFAQAIAISFTSPLFATAGAAIFLHETVKLRRWSATIVGFIGVIIIMQPGSSGFSLGVIVALAAAATGSATSLMVKDLVRTEPTTSVVTYMVLLMTPLSLIPALFVWTWPQAASWPWIVGMGVSGTLGHLAWTRAFSLAEASAVMPYDYSRLLFGAAIGFVLFNEVPTLRTWIGAAIICAAAIYIAKREALRRQSAPEPAAKGPALVQANPPS